ncbi:NAD(P)-dependent oxidoreductase [Microbacterium sp. Sa4CUA7]|uniref:NAD(P)-dependent oxidoreductase n=1 Tax=Microbacterium pullorum TaxID=2762236 RepID=A0ABR8S2S3_9MICO|nr:NAD(P)-dependent oxidoreductase [Microbacterium pullorum]MBD7957664.1 NAD(P)-dependent oxidoreductase [Microbacterium pullorum]
MSRIVVTGGAGRLGRTLAAGLAAAGHDVLSLDRATSPALESAGVTQREIDLCDAPATRAALEAAHPEAVVHLAAIAVPFSAPEDVILRTNAALAMSVLGGAVAAGVTRVVAASSPTVLGYHAPAGWLPERFPLDERTPPRPWNAYALSKLVIEQTVDMLRRQVGDAVRFASFRPCYVLTPEEWAGEPTQQGHTVRERLDDPALAAPALFNYVDARDVARFTDTLLAALPDIPNGETFFVGADDALARRPLAELLPLFVPGSAELAAGLTGTLPAFSNAKARRLLGWAPRHSWRTELADVGATTDADVPTHATATLPPTPARKDAPV